MMNREVTDHVLVSDANTTRMSIYSWPAFRLHADTRIIHTHLIKYIISVSEYIIETKTPTTPEIRSTIIL
jgi:hypothetical protein